MSKKQVIFVQGYGDYSDGVWPNWLAHELVKFGFDFNYVNMPDIMYPEVNEWVNFLKKQKISVDKNTYFVGHSLGCITIARYLETLSKGITAGGCVFVAGFCSLPKVPLLSEFCTLPLDFSKVIEHAGEVVVVLSDNDNLIPRVSSEEFALKLSAKIIIENNKGHFKSDVKEIHSVLNTILEMDQMNKEKREMKSLKRSATRG